MYSNPIPAAVSPAAVPLCVKGPQLLAKWLEPSNPGKDLFTSEEWRALARAMDLSERQLAVVILLVEGCSRDEIAACLRKSDGSNISTDTLRVYIDRIFLKSRVHDRLGLVLRLVRAHRELFGRGT